MAENKPTKEEISRRQKKTVSVKKLAEQISGLRQKVTKDMKSDDEKVKLTATAVALMDCTAERVGNDASAGDGHVGVTGFQKKHVAVSGNKVTLKYVGKSGVDHDREFTDERIAKVLKECLKRCKSPTDFVLTTPDGYHVKADRINRYLKEYGVTAKDIRGYSANHMVIQSLKNRAKSPDEAERKKVMSEVLQKVADRVGHGKATLRKHYLLPNLEDDYVKKGKMPSIKAASMRLASERVADFFYMRRFMQRVAGRTLQNMLKELGERVRNHVEEAYVELFGTPSNLPKQITVEISDDLPEGKIGSYRYKNGLMKIAPLAFDRGSKHVYYVIAHELAHAAIGPSSDKHGKQFQELATALDIPKGYQD